MNNNQEIKKQVEQILPEKRYEHTLRVVNTAIHLAEKFGENKEKVECAALLHDVAKYFEPEEMKTIILRDADIPNDYLQFHMSLWHAPVGAVYAKEAFQIMDQDILNAISYHTTGRNGMSLLEKIVFLADYIEPGRSFPGVELVRESAEEDLDKSIAMSLKNTIEFLASRSKQIYPNTIHAYNAFISKLGGSHK